MHDEIKTLKGIQWLKTVLDFFSTTREKKAVIDLFGDSVEIFGGEIGSEYTTTKLMPNNPYTSIISVGFRKTGDKEICIGITFQFREDETMQVKEIENSLLLNKIKSSLDERGWQILNYNFDSDKNHVMHVIADPENKLYSLELIYDFKFIFDLYKE
jgi:hypothetical protein